MTLNGIFNFWALLDWNVLKHFSLPPFYIPLPSLLPSQFKWKSLFLGLRAGFITDLSSRAERTLNSWSSICCLGLAKLGVRCALVAGRCFAFSGQSSEVRHFVPALEGCNLVNKSPTWIFFCILQNHLVLRILKHSQTSRSSFQSYPVQKRTFRRAFFSLRENGFNGFFEEYVIWKNLDISPIPTPTSIILESSSSKDAMMKI